MVENVRRNDERRGCSDELARGVMNDIVGELCVLLEMKEVG